MTNWPHSSISVFMLVDKNVLHLYCLKPILVKEHLINSIKGD